MFRDSMTLSEILLREEPMTRRNILEHIDSSSEESNGSAE